MEDRFVWKAEIRFEGTAEQFNKLMEAAKEMPVRFKVPEWANIEHHVDGCMRTQFSDIFSQPALRKLVEGMPQMEIEMLLDIRGGIRTPHCHLGDKVVLLDREKFKKYAGSVAQALVEKRIDEESDYISVMGAVGRLADQL